MPTAELARLADDEDGMDVGALCIRVIRVIRGSN
jgi:hypothetical protein